MATRLEHARRSGRSSKWITPTRRLAIYIRDGFTCLYCGTDLRDMPPREVGLDHLVPRCQGGDHHESNLVTACAKCNFSRQDRPWRAFALSEAVRARIVRHRRRALNRPLALAVYRGETSRAEALRA